jgi:radical SAM superfamily enzyme YgiQ (UPF0313 family)
MASGLLISYAGLPVAVSSLFPDNGLASLAGTLLAAGHRVRVLDYNTVGTLARTVAPERSAALRDLLPALAGEPDADSIRRQLAIDDQLEADLGRVTGELIEEISAEVERQRADFVGFKLWSGDGFLTSCRIAAALKARFAGLAVYGGGPAVTYCEHGIFAHTDAFDALVDGEGEPAICGLAACAEGRAELAEVPNLIIPDGGKGIRTRRALVPELDALPDPVYDPEVYPALAGDEQIHFFVIDESRGCPMGCAFCAHQSASGDHWRVRAPQRVHRLAASLAERFGSRAFRLGGSYTPADFFSALCHRLEADPRAFRFCGFAHPEGLPPGLPARLAAAGCRSLFLGVESFDPADQRMLGKHLDPQRAEEVIRECSDAGMVPVVSLIIPAPGQSAQARERNRKRLTSLCGAGRGTAAITMPGLTPRTRWWRKRQKYGFELTIAEDEYRALLASYKIRHTRPPSCWQPLPYQLDGADFAGYAGASARFQAELSRGGVAVNLPDEVNLLAELFREETSAFQRRLRALLLGLEVEALSAFAAESNRRLEDCC